MLILSIIITLLAIVIYLIAKIVKNKELTESYHLLQKEEKELEEQRKRSEECAREAIEKHLVEEATRLQNQMVDRQNFLDSVITPPKESFLKFQGVRTRKTVATKENGFEYLRVSQTENIDRPGVYGIYAGEILLYVGKANGAIRTRLRDHAKSAQYITEGGAQQSFLYEAMRQHKDILDGRVLAFSWNDSPSEIAELEMKLIKELKPLCNIVVGSSK